MKKLIALFIICLLVLPTMVLGQAYEWFEPSIDLPNLDEPILKIDIDKENNLWLITSSEIYRSNGKDIFQFDNPFSLDIKNLTAFQDGNVFISDGRRVALWEENIGFVKKDKDFHHVFALGNQSILSSSKGLFERKEDAWIKLEALQGAKFIFESDGLDYFVYDKFIYQRKLTTIAKIVGSKDLFGSSVVSASTDNKGKLFLLLKNGVLLSYDALNKISQVPPPFFTCKKIFHSEHLFVLSEENDLYYLDENNLWKLVGQDFDINTFKMDITSSVWLNDRNKLKLLRQSIFQNIKTGHIFNNTPVQCLTRDCAGSFLFGWDNKGIFTMDVDENIQQAFWAKELSNKRVTAIASDQNCHLWIGTAGYGMYYFDGFKLKAISSQLSLEGVFISDIEVEPNGNIWVGSRDAGVNVIALNQIDTTMQLLQPWNEPLQNEKLITDLYKDHKGRIWVGTSNTGVYCFDGFELQYQYATAKPGEYNPVLKIEEWNNKGICIATRQREVHFLKTSGKAGAYAVVPVSNAIQSFIKNQEEQLFTYNGKQLGEWVSKKDQFSIENKGVLSSGFQILDTQINPDNGMIYLATDKGLKKWSGGITNRFSSPKSIVRLTDMQLNYSSLKEFRLHHKNFSHTQNSFGFGFQSKTLYPSTIRYQWKLEGADDDWSPSSDQTTVNYSTLPPGNYTFRVRTSDQTSEDHITFTIKPVWWQNRMLQALLTILLGYLGFTFIRNYYKRKQLKEHQAFEKLSMENQVLSLKQQALQLQMNPHFIFNALTSIQNLVGQEDPKKARYYLAKFSRLMRNILEHSRKDFISIEEEMKLLDDYLSVEKLVHNDRFDFSIVADDNIDPSTHIAPMMLQPFAENAVKYGASKVTDGKVKIDFQLKGKNIACTIRDNGPGFNENENKEHTSISMEVISERLALLQKNVKNHVSINSSDEGSVVQITLPIM